MAHGPAQAEGEGSTSTFAALAFRDYRLLWTGLLFTNTGVWMQQFALGYYVVQLAVRDGVPDRGPLYLGLVAASRAVPALLMGLVAGTIADRVDDRRRILIGVQSGAAAISGMLALLGFTDRLGLAVIMAASAVAGVVGAFDTPSRQGMVPRLVPRPAIASAVGLLLGSTSVATLLGPLIGGVLIGPIGVPGLLLINSLGFSVVIGALLLMRPVPGDPAGRSSSVLRSMQEGFAYAWRDQIIQPLFVVLVLMSLLARPITTMMPAVAENLLHVGAVELSWLFAASGIGALAGSIVSASLGGFQRRGLLVIAFAVLSGVFLDLFAVQTAILLAVAFAAISSFMIQVHIVNHVTVYQIRTPSHLQGRVVGTSSTLVGSFQSLGALLLGSLATVLGLEGALLLAGVALVLASAYVLHAFPPLRGEIVHDEHIERAAARAMSAG